MPLVPAEAEKIVVLAPNWVGDAVMFTPTLRAIRARFAEAHLALAARPGPAAVLSPNPWTDEVILDRGRLLPLIGDLRRGRFDLAVLGPNSFRSALAAWAGKVKRRVGYARDGRGLLLTDPLAPPRTPDGRFAVTPALEYYLKLAEHLGCDVSDRRMELAVAESDADAARRLFEQAGITNARPLVVVNPGASYGEAKMYPAERFAAVADQLVRHRRARIVITGSPAEGAVAGAVESAMETPPALNLARAGSTLGLVKAVVARADLVVTNDTGPRHIAAALGAAVVTIFGPTDPGWTEINYERERIVRVDVPCGPCQRPRCPLPPGPEHQQCMERIPPEMVVAAAEELLDRGRSP